MTKILHCNAYHRADERYDLEPLTAFRKRFRCQVLLAAKCPHCQGQAAAWFGIDHEGKKTPQVKISPAVYVTEWLPRVKNGQLYTPSELQAGSRCRAGDYTLRMTRASDANIAYLDRETRRRDTSAG